MHAKPQSGAVGMIGPCRCQSPEIVAWLTGASRRPPADSMAAGARALLAQLTTAVVPLPSGSLVPQMGQETPPDAATSTKIPQIA